MTLGVLVFLFVGYQLWGTGLTEQREQKALAAQFKQQMVTSPVPPGDTVPTTSGSIESGDVPTLSTPAPATLPANGTGAELGDAIAQLEIPKLDLDKFIIEGVGVEDLKKGPGHYPGTALPGGSGNAAIAGHRTTYGAPFFRLDELEAGDPIFITTPGGRYRYDVSELKIVGPEDAWVLDPTEDNRLTLTTCHPRYSAAQRLIVVAELVSAPASTTPVPAPLAPNQPEPPPRVVTERAGLSGGVANKGPALTWGAAAGVIGLGPRLVARQGRRRVVYLVAAPVFLFALFGFYENVARLLPANV